MALGQAIKSGADDDTWITLETFASLLYFVPTKLTKVKAKKNTHKHKNTC